MKYRRGSQSMKHSTKERVFLSMLSVTILCNDQFIIYILPFSFRARKMDEGVRENLLLKNIYKNVCSGH